MDKSLYGNTNPDNKRRRMKIILGAALLILTVAVFLFRPAPNPQQAAQADAQDLVARISKLMVLPTGEVPTAATVVDPEKLRTVPFFKDAKNGDRILIYANAQEIILYDPSANKILGVAPFTINTK